MTWQKRRSGHGVPGSAGADESRPCRAHAAAAAPVPVYRARGCGRPWQQGDSSPARQGNGAVLTVNLAQGGQAGTRQPGALLPSSLSRPCCVSVCSSAAVGSANAPLQQPGAGAGAGAARGPLCAAPALSISSIAPWLPSSFSGVSGAEPRGDSPVPGTGVGLWKWPWGAGDAPKGTIPSHKSLSEWRAQRCLRGKAAFVFLVRSPQQPVRFLSPAPLPRPRDALGGKQCNRVCPAPCRSGARGVVRTTPPSSSPALPEGTGEPSVK